MGSTVSGLADAVLGVVQGVGLSSDTVARYGKCCEAVVEFCGRRGLDALSGSVVEEFVACQQERARRGEIGPNRRNALVKSARLMLEFQAAGAVTWRMMSPDPDLALSGSSRAVLKQFAAAAGQEVGPGSVRLLAGEIRQFLAYLDRAGRGALGTVTADDVRGFLVEVAPRRTAGTGNVVWSLKRFFAFLNAAGLSDVRIDGLLARAAPRRVRALPCFTRAETGCLIKGIDTGTPCGKRDYAMVALAVSTGLRCCDIVALRLEEIDWRRDEIRLVQAKTSRPLVLPALAGNAVAEWILHGRPDCGAPEVFVRLQPPHVKLGNSTGPALMRRRLARAGIDHVARDGKSFHALRRTAGTRLIESGAGLPLAAQILGHARVNSSGRYFALASEQLRQCCLPLEEFACTREGLR
jgi:site-specific recombinase XerD